MTENRVTEKEGRKGAINLAILGVASVVVAVVTTSISLMIYHYSGDIYLDRSRPGYLPDEEEIEENDSTLQYKFNKSGEMDMTILEEYIENLEKEVKNIDYYDNAFGPNVLLDEQLGIPIAPTSE